MGNAVVKVRLIKFVGDPMLVKEDGWGVPNWTYENNRVIAFNRHRVLRPGDCADWVYDENGKPVKPIPGTGIKNEYIWERRETTKILAVADEDAFWIIKNAGDEFKDVTDVPNPELVTNDKIVVKAKKREQRAV